MNINGIGLSKLRTRNKPREIVVNFNSSNRIHHIQGKGKCKKLTQRVLQAYQSEEICVCIIKVKLSTYHERGKAFTDFYNDEFYRDGAMEKECREVKIFKRRTT